MCNILGGRPQECSQHKQKETKWNYSNLGKFCTTKEAMNTADNPQKGKNMFADY